jgi:hypothetical protein
MIPMLRISIAMLSLVVYLGCQRDETMRSFVPDISRSFVVVFKSGTTQKEINKFFEDHLIVGDFQQGYELRSGIVAIVDSSVEGHDGYTVGFAWRFSEKEQEAIKEGIRASPVVLGVFERMRPGDISLDESEETRTSPNARQGLPR